MTAAGVFVVVPYDKSGFKALKEFGQTIRGRMDKKVYMIIHQAICIYLTVIFLSAI